MKLYSLDLFSGCGGLTWGMNQAGFTTKIAIDIDPHAVATYLFNYKNTCVIQDDIRNINTEVIKKKLGKRTLHLLAGCPPCQGFSTVRKLNRRKSKKDERNFLIDEYSRFVQELMPLTIMMENVPGLENYYRFKDLVGHLKRLGYNPKIEIVNVKDYGVPQRRKRLVLIGSLLGDIQIAKPTYKKITVREAIGNLQSVKITNDRVHKIYARNTPKILKLIKLIPKDGGSLKDLPIGYHLKCHEPENIGFSDVYGRMSWDDYSPTITGGCLNPSKGRFVHPIYDRSITAREAALLQTFPRSFKFPSSIPKTSLALLIGNALPPRFSLIQSLNIKQHLLEHLG